jgi:hypothetical protein
VDQEQFSKFCAAKGFHDSIVALQELEQLAEEFNKETKEQKEST